ncbi:MAG: hypothetical protein JNG90_20215 [Planctomycetaceae bacterium]|nr:hypothetical protein [Planctomycetaceae bacterium]
MESLAPFRDLVGAWRGVGQPQRGSTRGAWVEKGQWEWKFADGHATLVFRSPEGKVIRDAELRPATAAGVFDLIVQPPPPTPKSETPQPRTTYTGKADADGRLVVTASDPPADLPARITLGLVANGDRLIMLLERKAPAGERFSRLAEVGFTREGSQFGKGTTQPECVVTGGHASIAVEHEGKTYYVCCGGCRDLFNEDPAQVLADYRERKAAEKQDAKP